MLGAPRARAVVEFDCLVSDSETSQDFGHLVLCSSFELLGLSISSCQQEWSEGKILGAHRLLSGCFRTLAGVNGR